MSKFEDNLWADLKHEHAAELLQSVATQRRLRTRRWMGVAAGVVVLGATAVVAPVYFGGTPPAYAVVDNPDGSVTLTVREVQRFEEATAKLRERGISAMAVPLRRDCPAQSGSLQIPMSAVDIRSSANVVDITISPNGIPAGATVVLATDVVENGHWVITGGVFATDQPPACLLDRSQR